LQISRATARFLREGHPWVRPDRFTVGLDRLTTGDVVTLVDEDGRAYGTALADPQAEICARMFHRKPGAAFDPAAAIARAWARRSDLHADPGTDCYRVVHGEADFLPGLRIERYGSVFVVLVFADCIGPYVDAVCAALHDVAKEVVASPVIVVREHRDDLRRAGVSERRWDGLPIDAEAVVEGRELGCRFPLRPFSGLATGLYVDQRATRVWLRPQIAGKRVLNLFAYTGAFSVSLLQAGAAAALDVDLAGPALARAVEAAALNGVADRHRIAHGDCRRVLMDLDETFDVVICDPPTAAQGGQGWVLRRDYPRLLAAAATRLAPAGLLVACCNTIHGRTIDLQRALADCGLAQVAGPELGEDLPQLAGFPEGRPFRLAVGRR
jgi:23S rRNA (cytosine1962-C5)-methyltransferase